MSFRFMRRKWRCVLKHGPRGCPHIERHTRRSKQRPQASPAPPLPQVREVPGRHALH